MYDIVRRDLFKGAVLDCGGRGIASGFSLLGGDEFASKSLDN